MSDELLEGRTAARNGTSGRARLRWHRRIGLSLSALFVVVVGTGLLLNHAEDLGLRQRALQADWLYRWYDMQPATPPVGFPVGDRWVIALERTISLDAMVMPDFGPAVGAIPLGETIVVAAPREIVVLDADGELVERLTSAALPGGAVSRVGRLANQDEIILETDTGGFRAGADLLDWRPFNGDEFGAIAWSAPAQPPEALATAAVAAYRGESLTAHRVVLDLHSGRFFGPAGVVLVDLAAIGLLFLALSGAWYAWRTRPRAE